MQARYHPRREDDESGEYYVVTSKHGHQTIVKRPNPPPTSPPLEDDFDAITQGCTTTYRGPASEWGARVRDSAVPTTSPPLDDDFDAITYTATNALSRRNSAVPRLYMNPNRNVSSVRSRLGNGMSLKDESRRWGGDFGEEWEEHRGRAAGATSPYHEGWDRTDGSKVSGATERGHARPSGSGRTKAPYANVDRWKKTMQDNAPESSTGTVRKERIVERITTRTLKPQRRGLEYEMIDRRVVEDGPERTVTIATWREEVARKSRPDVEMSIFYVNPDDYAMEEFNNTGIAMVSAGSHAGLTRVPGERDREEDMRGRDERERKESYGSKATIGRGWASPIRDRRTSSDPVHSSRAKLSSPNPGHRTASPFVTGSFAGTATGASSKLASSSNIRAQRSRATTSQSRYRPLPDLPLHDSPLRKTPSPPTNHNRKHNGDIPPRTSSPFHATRSGSTISSIKGISPIRPSNNVERLLSSCQPSLSHVVPILRRLGIVSEDHLHALLRMSEETRNREVKEEALRKGMTVVEWAILLDKLQEMERR